jgi:hypothetical protein
VHLLSFFTVVLDDELDIDALEGFEKGMHGLHPKLEGEERSAFGVTHVRWRCQTTTRLYGSNTRCVIISLTILNWAIWRYHITFRLSTYNTCTYKCVYYSK